MGATTIPTSTIVGSLKCQADSYLQTFETVVVSCEEFIPPNFEQKSEKTKTKKSTDPAKVLQEQISAPGKTWLIELADSVLFPEGGGQPADHGFLTLLDQENIDPISIVDIQRHGLRCVHFSTTSIAPGTRVKQTVDFARRQDHMQQHTGQHLLSAIMDTMGLETLGWSMGAAGDINYVELPRRPSDDEVDTIQRKCNDAIRQNMPITVETPEGSIPESLPADYDGEKGVVRYIKIGNLDYNACCGTHVKQTSHIGLILLHHTQPIRGTNCRLFFSAGERATKFATEAINGIRSLAVSLSSGSAPADVLAKVDHLGGQVCEARKTSKRLLAEVAELEGTRMLARLEKQECVFLHRPLDGLDFLNLVVACIRDKVKERGVAVLCSGEDGAAGCMMIIGKSDWVEKVAAKAKETINTVKGGGRGETWQGKIMKWKKGEVARLKKVVLEEL